MCHTLSVATDTLGGAEDRYVAELADDVVPKGARDAGADELRTLYQRVRVRLEDALGRRGLKRYGLETPAPRPPDALRARVQTTIDLMREDPAELDDGVGDPIPTATIADNLQAALTPLAGAISTLRTEERENEGALTDRNRAVDAWTGVYRGVATMLSGLYQLAGRDNLADRIRPTVRRASGIDDATPPADAGASDAGASDAQA